MRKIKLFFVALATLACGLAYGQNITVTGVVTDGSTGEPLSGAAILVKGTPLGVVADNDGRYSISVAPDGTLGFTTIGFKDVEEAVNGRTVINVALEPDNELLDDVIVVAYGTSTKSSFTGSASMVKSEAIEKKVATNVTSALAGTTPGVQVISNNGDPASNKPTIRIRGIGSMSASNNPLVILDGVPYDGSISDINPNDVESMSVLKDASASAIYGHRGANGVILITTKRGQAGDATIKFDARFGSNSRLVPQYDVISDPGQYYEQVYKKLYNSYIYAGYSQADAYAKADKNIYDKDNGGVGYHVFTLPEGQKLIGNNLKLNPNAKLGYSDGTYYYQPDDWYNEVFHNSFRQEYNLSVSGAGDKFNYYASAGFLDDGGIVNNSGFKRYTGRVNAEYQVRKWFKLLTNASFTHTDSKTASYDDPDGSWGSSGNIFYITNTIAPIYPLYVRNADGTIKMENGRIVYDSNNTNFIRASVVGNAIRDNEYDSSRTFADKFNGKFGAVLTPVKGLSLSANLGILADNSRYNNLYSPYGSGAATDGQVSVGHERTWSINQQYLAEYKTDFGASDHNLDVLAGYEQYNYTYQTVYGSNDHLFNPLVGEASNADGSDKKNIKSYTNYYMTEGFLARVQYDYAGKYFLSGSFRRDASSRFAVGHQWGNFWSAGAAWLISQEDFMANASWVDMLKLKLSYGQQGNDNLGSYYPYADNYTHSYNNDTGEYSLSLNYKGNENLTWETSKALNGGVDFDFWGGKLAGSVEVFSRKTENLLYNKDVPLSSGNPTGYVPVNVGSILNNGFEVTLNGNIINTRNVRWDWNVNASSFKNTILSLDESVEGEGIKSSYYIYRVGGSLYNAYMYKFAGVNPENGKGLYWKHTDEVRDPNGVLISEAKDETTSVFDEATRYDLGTVLPKLYGGFGSSLNAYGFDFSFQFSFQLGGKYYDSFYQALMWTQDNTGSALHKDVLKAWTPENTNTNVPRWDGDVAVSQSSVDRFLTSSNYLNLNNVTLGYTFPKKWTSKIAIQGLRIYVAGENVLLLTARKGMDPRNSLGLQSYAQKTGANTYSALRTVTGGISLTF